MISTLNSKISIDDTSDISMILINESMFHDLSKKVTSDDRVMMAIDTVTQIRAEPLICYQNVVSNSPLEVEHEVFQLLKDHEAPKVTEGPNKSVKLIIVETTREEEGRSDDFLAELEKTSKYVKTVRPYLPFSEFIPEPTASEAKIFTVDYVVQKLETNFFLDKINPGFVGMFKAKNLKKYPNSNEALCYKGAALFCKKYGCPIYVDSEGLTFSEVHALIDKETVGLTLLSSLPVQRKDSRTFNFETGRIVTSSEFDTGNLIEACRAGYFVDFSIFKLISAGLSLEDIAQIFKRLMPDEFILPRMMLSVGLFYKTDYLKFGGRGLRILNDFIGLLLNQGVPKPLIDILLVKNPRDYLLWWKPLQIKPKEVHMWKCWECKKEYAEDVQKISKFDYEFCSPPCFKQGLKKIPK